MRWSHKKQNLVLLYGGEGEEIKTMKKMGGFEYPGNTGVFNTEIIFPLYNW